MSAKKNDTRILEMLEGASPSALEEAFENVLKKTPPDSWLPNDNRYKANTIGHLKKDKKTNNIYSRDLAEYIAVSGPLHAIDGWAYLGRAVDAHLRGDCGAALHLGYYAELRAAMSLLATQGIGVFDRNLCIVKGPDECVLYDGDGTHQASWKILQHWAAGSAAAEVLVSTIQPSGRSLEDYVGVFSSSKATVSALATDWLEMWGVDLQLFVEDRQKRNLASYHPVSLEIGRLSSIQEILAFGLDLWHLFDPGPSARFGELDRHLLRYSLETLFRAETMNSVKKAPKKYSERIGDMLKRLSPKIPLDDDLREFLKDKKYEPPLLMREARRENSPFPAGDDAPVIARAALLLRLATGVCEGLFSRTDAHSSTTVQDWLERIGTGRGLWRPRQSPDSLCDLWIDVDEAVKSLDSWLKTHGGGGCSLFSLAESRAHDLRLLGSCERVGLWGLGL